ncbi:hypothetical protein EXU57_22845 [Segetibacter sp. 3557_3]|uniref:hypothetical protein n=1 Tax=Segetibacter sp. 3557_3 TaxID=2547429 RepID=UPI0010585201|nr:hypothetical protein [Segetibacter sp. 3557_3]TDH19740.1 hypothetical protein EXU57_22845 [Segetibacter sp. 3557_3]
MNLEFTYEAEMEIIKFLYQFKDDNKFYRLEDQTSFSRTADEKYSTIYKLRDKALIATDREVFHTSTSSSAFLNDLDQIKARILPKGIVAVESLLQQEPELQ